jgi:phage gp36-like protein
MSYTTDADLYSLIAARTLTQLAADDPLAEAPDPLILAEARAYADAQVDARLRQRYPLPLASVPRELTDWSLALARHWLYSRRPEGQDLPPAVVDAYRDALKALDAVRDGKMSLAVTSGGGTPASEAGRVIVSAPDRLFTADKLSAY